MEIAAARFILSTTWYHGPVQFAERVKIEPESGEIAGWFHSIL
jgi:hypothetical protein